MTTLRVLAGARSAGDQEKALQELAASVLALRGAARCLMQALERKPLLDRTLACALADLVAAILTASDCVLCVQCRAQGIERLGEIPQGFDGWRCLACAEIESFQ